MAVMIYCSRILTTYRRDGRLDDMMGKPGSSAVDMSCTL